MIQQTTSNEVDLGEVTHLCICGSQFWNVQVAFEDYDIAMYFTEMSCVNCGARALAPTPADRPGSTIEEHLWD